MEINVLIEPGVKADLDPAWLQTLAERALTAEHVSDTAELSLVITTPVKIRELNRTYLEEDAPTDVLSFPMGPGKSTFVTPPDGKLHLGEIIISHHQAAIQAQEHGHSVKKEMAVLLIHGVLHILGYDHATPEEQQRMQAREAEVLKLLEDDLVWY